MNVQDINSLASQLKVATDEERLELIAAIQQKETYLKVLNKFAVSLIQIKSQEDLLWFVAKEVVGQLGFVDCVIYLLDPNDQTLVQQAAMGDKSPSGREIINPMRIPLGTGVTGRVASQAMPIIVGDLAKYPGYVEDMNPARSELCVPMLYNGEVLGVIDCEHPSPDNFSREHLELLTSVAAMTSTKLKECEFVETLEAQNKALRERHIELEKALEAKGGDIEQAPTPPSPRSKVLIVEDNGVNQMLIASFVTKFGWSSTIVSNGAEAVETLSSDQSFDMVLMDIRMPVMDGVEATQKIRKLPGNLSQLPIIALTANAEPDDAATYLSAGMNAVVPKPIDKQRLQCAMAGLMAQTNS